MSPAFWDRQNMEVCHEGRCPVTPKLRDFSNCKPYRVCMHRVWWVAISIRTDEYWWLERANYPLIDRFDLHTGFGSAVRPMPDKSNVANLSKNPKESGNWVMAVLDKKIFFRSVKLPMELGSSLRLGLSYASKSERGAIGIWIQGSNRITANIYNVKVTCI